MSAIGFWARLDGRLRCVTPFAVTLTLAIMPSLPLGLPSQVPAAPWFTLMAVFYWTIYRPDLMPALAVFAAGLMQDLMTGATVGMTPLILLTVYNLVLKQRRTFIGKPFLVTYWGFALVATGAAVATYVLGCLLSRRVLAPDQSILQYLTTLALFPALVWFFVRTHRRVLVGI